MTAAGAASVLPWHAGWQAILTAAVGLPAFRSAVALLLTAGGSSGGIEAVKIVRAAVKALVTSVPAPVAVAAPVAAPVPTSTPAHAANPYTAT